MVGLGDLEDHLNDSIDLETKCQIGTKTHDLEQPNETRNSSLSLSHATSS